MVSRHLPLICLLLRIERERGWAEGTEGGVQPGLYLCKSCHSVCLQSEEITDPHVFTEGTLWAVHSKTYKADRRPATFDFWSWNWVVGNKATLRLVSVTIYLWIVLYFGATFTNCEGINFILFHPVLCCTDHFHVTLRRDEMWALQPSSQSGCL